MFFPLAFFFVGSSLKLCGLVIFVLYLSHEYHFGISFSFLLLGSSGSVSHRACSGDSFFFVDSLLQRCNVVSVMHGLVELLDCLDDHDHAVLSCVRAPWTWGFFVCFAPYFDCPM